MSKICPVCGEIYNTYYPICYKCNQLKEEGKVIKCEKCGTWHYADKPCPNCDNTLSLKECLICKKLAKNNDFCEDCLLQIQEFSNSIDKNKDITQIQDYYFNIKSNLWSCSDYYFKTSLYKMTALALIAKNQFERNSLYNRLQEDISNAVTKREIKNKENEKLNKNNTFIQSNKAKVKEEQKELDKRRIVKTDDGHKVLSDGEKNIDNALYALRIPHSYGQEIPFSTIEGNRYCDWFIPVKSDRQGIYIEYWGMEDNPEYLKTKKEKTEAYKNEELLLISIEKDEPITDSQRLKMRLIKDINQLAKSHFGIDKFIKY